MSHGDQEGTRGQEAQAEEGNDQGSEPQGRREGWRPERLLPEAGAGGGCRDRYGRYPRPSSDSFFCCQLRTGAATGLAGLGEHSSAEEPLELQVENSHRFYETTNKRRQLRWSPRSRSPIPSEAFARVRSRTST